MGWTNSGKFFQCLKYKDGLDTWFIRQDQRRTKGRTCLLGIIRLGVLSRLVLRNMLLNGYSSCGLIESDTLFTVHTSHIKQGTQNSLQRIMGLPKRPFTAALIEDTMRELVTAERKLETSWSASLRGGGGEVSDINSPSWPKPLYQSEAWHSTINMKMSLRGKLILIFIRKDRDGHTKTRYKKVAKCNLEIVHWIQGCHPPEHLFPNFSPTVSNFHLPCRVIIWAWINKTKDEIYSNLKKKLSYFSLT